MMHSLLVSLTARRILDYSLCNILIESVCKREASQQPLVITLEIMVPVVRHRKRKMVKPS